MVIHRNNIFDQPHTTVIRERLQMLDEGNGLTALEL